MKPSLLSIFRNQKKLFNVLILLISWTQVYGYSYSLYFNRSSNVKSSGYPDINSNFRSGNPFSSERPKLASSDKKKPHTEAAVVQGKIIYKTLSVDYPVLKTVGGSNKYYFSDIKEGVVGKDKEHPIDQVYDNIFNITLDKSLPSQKQAWLEYELYGVESASGISKSINDDLSNGGLTVNKNQQWTLQAEAIALSSLKEGTNTILFTIDPAAGYTYKVKNVRIRLSSKKESNVFLKSGKSNNTVSKLFNIGHSDELTVNTASLKVAAVALTQAENFSITPLSVLDIPALAPEMVNVTNQDAGYRFLPHGEHFSAPALVSIGYDKSKIPAGYTEQDIKTYFFDKVEKKWMVLEKDSLITEKNILVSKTTHFTDMINGILKVPESPETGSYTPNSIKDIQAADPSAGIVGINAPSPNSMGTVNTSFPIKLPAGRQGMEPSLSVNYTSEGGNGWMGQGWDLSIPSINIDTRWGVPTYDADKETEIYTLGGEQLTFKIGTNYVLPNRTEGFNQNRTAERQFWPRVEGSYNKMIRHGSSPSTYWWEVIRKDGTKNYFGGDGTNVVDNAVLRQPGTNNIGHWALYRTVDTNGNYIQYTYDKTPYNSEMQEIVINEINYTLHNTNNPTKNYKITFETVSGRQDVQTNARLGFLQATSKLLNNISINYGTDKVRSYDFTYIDGAFYKKLLSTITEKGTDDVIFYTNRIEYNKAPETIFTQPREWKLTLGGGAPNIESQYFTGPFLPGIPDVFKGDYTAINSNKSDSKNNAFRLGFWGYKPSATFIPVPLLVFLVLPAIEMNRLSIGAEGGFGSSKSYSQISMFDVDGDNLPDTIYKIGDKVYYAKNTSGGFLLDSKNDLGINSLGYSESSSWNVGLDGNISLGSGIGVGIGFDYLNSTTKNKIYFNDFNSDGLVDLSSNGKVLFNYLKSDGVPSFTESSGTTPAPVIVNEVNPSNSFSFDANEKKMMLEQNPLHDVVRVWVAPRTGTVSVASQIKLLDFSCTPANEDCTSTDGVSASIQKGSGNPVVINFDADEKGVTKTFNYASVAVTKGEKLYFRLTSKYNGKLDQVEWNPVISYSGTPVVDGNNRNLGIYNFKDDFVISNGAKFKASDIGNLNLNISKATTSDHIKVTVIKNGTPTDYPYTDTSVYSNATIDDLQLKVGDEIEVKVYSDTDIRWTDVQVTPKFTSQSGEISYGQVEYTMYNNKLVNAPVNTITITSVFVNKSFTLAPAAVITPGKNGVFYITGKIENRLIGKFGYKIENNVLSAIPILGTTTNTFTSADLNKIFYIEISTPSTDSAFLTYLQSLNFKFTRSDAVVVTAVSKPQISSPYIKGNYTNVLPATGADERLGNLYRGWGSFIVNGNNKLKTIISNDYNTFLNYTNGGTIAEMKVDESKLLISSTASNNDSNTTISNPGLDSDGNPIPFQPNDSGFNNQYFVIMSQLLDQNNQKKWIGLEDESFISSTTIGVSRLGEDNIDDTFQNVTPTFQLGSDKLSSLVQKTKLYSVSGKAGVSFPEAVTGDGSFSKTIFSENKVISTIADYNGDGFPDHIIEDKVQFTNSNGFLSKINKTLGYNAISKSDAVGVGAGTGFTHGSGSTTLAKSSSLSNSVTVSNQNSVGLSGNFSKESEFAKKIFLDINGDGVPDKIDGKNVTLGIGYDFPGTAKNLGFDVNSSDNTGYGAGLGFSLFGGSIQSGTSYGGNTNQSDEQMVDLNNDGLLDHIDYTNNTYDLNLGNSFVQISTFPAASFEEKNVGVSEGKNFGLSIPLPGIPLVIDPTTTTVTAGLKIIPGYSRSTNKGINKTKSAFRDMNGDGYPDYITSEKADQIMVSLNQLGEIYDTNGQVTQTNPVNLLRKVTLPMGGSWEVTYQRIGNTYDMPESKYVMTSVVVKDGFAQDDQFKPGVSKITAAYTTPYHSRRERTFYGFGQVRINQIDTAVGGEASTSIFRYTVQNYNNTSYFLKGALLDETLYDAAGRKWSQSVNSISARSVNNTNSVVTLPVKEAEKTLTNYAYFVTGQKSLSSFYQDGLLGKSTFTETTAYDNLGNPTSYKDYGDQEIGSTELLTTQVVYQTTDSGSDYLILPAKVTTTGIGVSREKTAEYDTKGNLENMTITGPGNPVSSFEYDAYGNITKSTQPANSAGQKFYHTYSYDTNVFTYLVLLKDAFGYSSKTEYDYRFGLPVLTIDMNLQPMQYTYDAKGRAATITGPYEMFNDIPWTIEFIYHPITNAPLNATTAQSFANTNHYDPEIRGNTITTITIADGLGSPLEVKKTADVYGQPADNNVFIVSGKVYQDAFGRALKSYYPTLETAGPKGSINKYNADIDTVTPIVTTYDVLDRPLTTKLPGEDLFSTVKYDFATDREGRKMFQTTFTDELGTVKKTYTDIKQRTTTVHEPSNTGDIFTSFTHDAIGELLLVKDVQNNKTTSVYDNLGRRISLSHPDSGLSTFIYDAAGNLVSKTNSENETVSYKYDYTRLKGIKYPSYSENNVNYYYGSAEDATAADNNAVGRLWYQTDASGSQYFKYGKLGELTYSRRSVATQDAGVYWFATQWEYDTWNRVKNITYPDGEKLTYFYNKAGNLKSMSSVKDDSKQSYIDDIGYDKFEQRVYTAYGNGTVTQYEYETERRRLLKMQAKTRDIKGTGRLFMDNVYQYDVVSNVTGIHNNAAAAPAGLLGGGTNYAYGYDDLYRLTSASGNWRGKDSNDADQRQRYTLTMSYDNMYNIMEKVQKHETAEGSTGNNWITNEQTSYRLTYKDYGTKVQPHAPGRIVDEPNITGTLCCDASNPQVKFQDYIYDAKGNPLGITQQTCNASEPKTTYIWDEENRLMAVDTNPSTIEIDGLALYTYDAGGERIIKDVVRDTGIFVKDGDSRPRPVQDHRFTLYPGGLLSPTMNATQYTDNGHLYTVVGDISYTKHYYAGSQRISGKLGSSMNIGKFDCAWLIIPFGGDVPPINEKIIAKEKKTIAEAHANAMIEKLGVQGVVYGQNGGYTDESCATDFSGKEETDIYWYHPDHLGSSSFVTGTDGEVNQNIEYFPSGEVFVENHLNSYNVPYKFNSQELDDETGNYYYGARYYNPRISLWLSVDPLAEKFPGWSPYVMSFNNPVRFIDPDGMEPFDNGDDPPGNALSRFRNRTANWAENHIRIPLSGWFDRNTREPARRATKPLRDAFIPSPEGQALLDEIRSQGSQYMRDNVGGAYKLGAEYGLVGSGMGTGLLGNSIIASRINKAANFYKRAGFTAEAAAGHMEGINFENKVEEVVLKKGTTIRQWVRNQGQLGNYFTSESNGKVRNLGINDYDERTLKTFRLTKDTRVLRSTTSNFDGAKGGGTQYFSTELKSNIK